MEFGAKSITLPPVTPTTLLAIEKAEAQARRAELLELTIIFLILFEIVLSLISTT